MTTNLAMTHNFTLVRRGKETFSFAKKCLGPDVLCKVSCFHAYALLKYLKELIVK